MTARIRSAAKVPRVLSIAGTDPSGGAGTAADMKSITAAGGYGMTVVTSLVAQNTTGVRAIHTPPVDFLAAQLAAVSDDVRVDAVKTGMLSDADVIAAVESWIGAHRPPVLVVDPVMVATSGDRLLAADAEAAMRRFCRGADVVTPNIPELAVLTGAPPAADEADAVAQARDWAGSTGVAVIVKTGHLGSRATTNVWVRPDGSAFPAPSTRVSTSNTHGTGCSLSSALATRLGAGDPPEEALTWVTEWLHEAILHGHELHVGHGHGPVDHGHRARRLEAAASPAPWPADAVVPARLTTPDELAADAQPAPASVAAAGPWTEALWRAGSELVRAIHDGDFVAALVAGTLPEHSFSFYLAQDARYLAGYSRALAAVAATSPDPAESADWAGGAAQCQRVEAELHRSWLAGRTCDPSPETRAYIDFLGARAALDGHVVGAAAVLPCYWLYAEVGAALPGVPDAHPYAAWLSTYRDEGFVAATKVAIGHVERAMAGAGPADRAAAAGAYLIACRHEAEFFDQALRAAPGDAPRRAAS